MSHALPRPVAVGAVPESSGLSGLSGKTIFQLLGLFLQGLLAKFFTESTYEGYYWPDMFGAFRVTLLGLGRT